MAIASSGNQMCQLQMIVLSSEQAAIKALPGCEAALKVILPSLKATFVIIPLDVSQTSAADAGDSFSGASRPSVAVPFPLTVASKE